eukprot:1240313-Prymnesium_polylepis.1
MQKAGTSEVLAWLKTSKQFVAACSHDGLGGPGGDECHFYASLLSSPDLRIGTCPATFTAARPRQEPRLPTRRRTGPTPS